MEKPFHLALAQAPAEFDSPAERLDWLDSTLPDVTAQGADLLVLPELFACGYNIGDQIPARAEAQNGPTFAAMSKLAAQHNIALHYGYAERDGAQIYNAATCVCPQGTRLTHQRKLVIPPGFEQAYFTPGAGCALFTYRGLRIATLICYDAEFAETTRHVAAQGAELILVPTALGADWGWVAKTMIPTRAYENGVYLAYANSAGTQRDMTFLGASVIAAPNGTEAARAGQAPTLLCARIDPQEVRKAQKRLPYLRDRTQIKLNCGTAL